MHLRENIRESIHSTKNHKLRSSLTILTITIGISCLVGILTTVESMRISYAQAFNRLGTNNFAIRSVANKRNRKKGLLQKIPPNLRYQEAKLFTKQYSPQMGLSAATAVLTDKAILRQELKRTEANIILSTIDENYEKVANLQLEKGRHFTAKEVNNGAPVIIIGEEVYLQLFEPEADPIDAHIVIYGKRYKVVGKAQRVGQAFGRLDSYCYFPLKAMLQLPQSTSPQIEIKIQTHENATIEEAIGAGIALMRNIRGDRLGADHSFQINHSKQARNHLDIQMDLLQFLGYTLGFITLLSACIGVLNTMLVYVKERTPEIGLRKALGGTAHQIRMQFLIESLYICLLGGILGSVSGLILGNMISAALLDGRWIIPLDAILVGLLISIVVGIIAGYLPANRAAKVDPIQSLRYE